MGRKEGMGKQSWVWVLGRGAGATETIKQNSKEKYSQLVPEHLRTRPQLEKISPIVLFLSKSPSPPSIAVVVATLGCQHDYTYNGLCGRNEGHMCECTSMQEDNVPLIPILRLEDTCLESRPGWKAHL